MELELGEADLPLQVRTRVLNERLERSGRDILARLARISIGFFTFSKLKRRLRSRGSNSARQS